MTKKERDINIISSKNKETCMSFIKNMGIDLEE